MQTPQHRTFCLTTMRLHPSPLHKYLRHALVDLPARHNCWWPQRPPACRSHLQWKHSPRRCVPWPFPQSPPAIQPKPPGPPAFCWLSDGGAALSQTQWHWKIGAATEQPWASRGRCVPPVSCCQGLRRHHFQQPQHHHLYFHFQLRPHEKGTGRRSLCWMAR